MDWKRTQVSSDRTHHLLDGEPLYAARFREVLKFHAPGLAPALTGEGAMHIRLDGHPAYASRFHRTFGFYEGLAAVDTGEGWMHIRPDGCPLSGRRFAWTGNYQGGRCAVRSGDGRYHHVDHEGRDAYAERWRYAGDFRDGIAVVQRDDGLHSHVGADGEPLHDRWFVDLDVFHKGFARARDHAGWHHVGTDGQSVYARRLAAVEPFYNGQARVERFDGGLEVIDEAGESLVELRPARRGAFADLSGDMVGFWRTEALAAAVRLGVPEALPATTAELAERLGLVPSRLEALLRGLLEMRVARRTEGTWALTDKGEFLLRDHALTLADAALEYAGPLGQLWKALPAAMRRDWRPPDVFGEVASDSTRRVSHHRMLRSYARHDYALVAQSLPLRGDERILDVGGGLGVLSRMLLDRHPQLSVVLLDRPEVVDQIEGREGLVPRAFDLFGDWGAEGEVVLLARVLHDWPEEPALQILRNARESLVEGGRLFLVEMLVEDDGAFGGLCDLHLLMATGGRERTRDEYERLLDQAGFDLTAVRTLPALPTVLVGVRR